MGFLTRDEMQAILDAPDPRRRDGVRDRAMLHLAFAGGLRVSELVGLRADELLLQPHPAVHIRGKGRRERMLPLWRTTAVALRALVLDGVFAERAGQPLRFHPAGPPTAQAIARLLVTIRRRVLRHLGRSARSQGAAGDDTVDRLADEEPLLAACYASSIGQRHTPGSRVGMLLERLGAGRGAPWVERRGRLQAHVEGFDLHAASRVASPHPEGRAPLEKLCIPSVNRV